MSETTKIQWCDHTFNPWIGCTKVSPGCSNCYAEVSTPSRAFGVKWGKGAPRRRTSEINWKEPLKWNRKAAMGKSGSHLTPALSPSGEGARPRVFCASLADWLDEEVPIEWLADLLKLIHATPNLDWLLLTKRPENFSARIKGAWFATTSQFDSFERWIVGWGRDGKAPANVWIGTTVEDQQRAQERIPALLNIPARVRFLSVEPLLEPVDLRFTIYDLRPDWVIVGGESGCKARPCNVAWVRSVVRQCKAAAVPVFVKQLGSNVTEEPCRRFTLTDRKGGDMGEWPFDLQVREFPGSDQGSTESRPAGLEGRR